MQCGVCGTAGPGEVALCPSCGHRLGRGGDSGAELRAPAGGAGLVRVVVYLLLFFGALHYGQRLYDQYLDAEKDRLEAGLLSQSLQRRAELQGAAQE